MQQLLDEVAQLSQGSIAFAQSLHHATTGDKLGRLVRQAIEDHSAAFNQMRAAVNQRLDDLGGVGEERGLFMLAADLATTEAVERDALSVEDRRELRSLWDDLRSR